MVPSRRGWVRLCLKLALPIVAATAVGCSRSTGDPPAVAGGWQSEVMWCSALDRDMFPAKVLTSATAQQLADAGCAGQHGAQRAPAGALGVAVAGTDRYSMRIAEATREHLVVEVAVPHEKCQVTADWRGDMVLIVGSEAADTVLPTVEFRDAPQPC